jgi:signal peptidase I
MKLKKTLKQVWYFIWESDSIWSWLVNIVLAFVIIKFLVYPGLGFLLQTDYPVVAVVSGSMEHKTPHPCNDYDRKTNICNSYDKQRYYLCDKTFSDKQKVDSDFFWKTCGHWYENNTQITKEDFKDFEFSNGFNTGDIMVLKGISPEKIEEGNVIVYMSHSASYPIIHRVVDIKKMGEIYTFVTKGDHNSAADPLVDQKYVIGKAVLRIPLLGWIKIGFVRLIQTATGM